MRAHAFQGTLMCRGAGKGMLPTASKRGSAPVPRITIMAPGVDDSAAGKPVRTLTRVFHQLAVSRFTQHLEGLWSAAAVPGTQNCLQQEATSLTRRILLGCGARTWASLVVFFV